jgi:hypothetical protein
LGTSHDQRRVDHDGARLLLRLGRPVPPRPVRDAEGALEGRSDGSPLGALIRGLAGAPAAALLLALAPPIHAQPEPGSALQLTAFAGALRVGDDFAVDGGSQWTAVAGARAGWRPAPQVTLAGEAWRASLERLDADAADGSLLGVGAFATFRPWIGRGWPADLAFDFGLEAIDADDDEERGPAFVFGIGVERALASRGSIEVSARHHFVTVDEEEVDGVATGRDAELWELRAGASLLLGGTP